MKFAILAAGEGSRLTQEGITLPKPLVKIGGEAMIARLIKIFVHTGADEIVIIINEDQKQTREFLQELTKQLQTPLHIVIQSTPSSMHSLYAISPYLKDDKFCVTTVDTIFPEREFYAYIEDFKRAKVDASMVVTPFVDDEKPLYVEEDKSGRIIGYHDQQTANCQYVSGGIYGLTPKCLDTLSWCINHDMARMRNFQRQLVAEGFMIKAFIIPKVIDVDHATDIKKAEDFLSNHTTL